MFVLSFVIGCFMICFGKECVMVVGMLFIVVLVIVVLVGFELINFWGFLVIMGIGWNFSFIGVMVMVIDCYMLGECVKV